MSDTPRTDAASFPPGDGWASTVVSVEFAEQLERENAALRVEITRLIGDLVNERYPSSGGDMRRAENAKSKENG